MVTVLKITAFLQCVTHVSGSREKRADIIYKLLCFSVLSGGYLKDDTGIHLCFTKPGNPSGRKSGGHWLKTLYGDQKPHNCLRTKIMVDIYNRPPKAREEKLRREIFFGKLGHSEAVMHTGEFRGPCTHSRQGTCSEKIWQTLIIYHWLIDRLNTSREWRLRQDSKWPGQVFKEVPRTEPIYRDLERCLVVVVFKLLIFKEVSVKTLAEHKLNVHQPKRANPGEEGKPHFQSCHVIVVECPVFNNSNNNHHERYREIERYSPFTGKRVDRNHSWGSPDIGLNWMKT